MYALHGREIAEDKGVSVRKGSNAGAKGYEPTNRNSIQGDHPGKSAQLTKSYGFRRDGKCCGCVSIVHFFRGDLSRCP
jgi:hypothetical protein